MRPTVAPVDAHFVSRDTILYHTTAPPHRAPLSCTAVQPRAWRGSASFVPLSSRGVGRGSLDGFRLTIMSFADTLTRTNRVILTLPAGKMGVGSTPATGGF